MPSLNSEVVFIAVSRQFTVLKQQDGNALTVLCVISWVDKQLKLAEKSIYEKSPL